MNHKVEISTSSIGHFVYDGLYNTIIGDYIGCVEYGKREEANDEIGKMYVDILRDVFGELFYDMDDDYELEYVRTYHPKFYNYEVDSIIFSFEYNDTLRDYIYSYAKDNYDFFVKFLADNYTSRDGFISFTPNNWSDWKSDFFNDDWRCVAAIVRYLVENCTSDSEKASWEYGLIEDAVVLIEEQYVPYEYAVKFDNGFVAVTKGEWNDSEDATVYTAWLVDENGNVVNTATVDDAYDEEFHMSAFAVWQYSYIESDLTKKHTLCGTHCEPCDIPDVEL